MDDESLETVMGIIINGGDAKNYALDAIRAAKVGKFDEADKKLEDAHQSIVKAHNLQTNMITKEASGDKVEINLLTIHSQDHLSNGITFTDLAKEFVELYKRLYKEKKIK